MLFESSILSMTLEINWVFLLASKILIQDILWSLGQVYVLQMLEVLKLKDISKQKNKLNKHIRSIILTW